MVADIHRDKGHNKITYYAGSLETVLVECCGGGRGGFQGFPDFKKVSIRYGLRSSVANLCD